MRTSLLAVVLLPSVALAGPTKERDWEAVEATGALSDYWYKRYYRAYYWAEDFTFLFKDDAGKTWRVISREPTPAYEWRMGPTYLERKTWKDGTRVKLVGVKAIDRIPVEFPEHKLDEKNIVTALLLWVEKAPGEWRQVYVNNWFHIWGPRADRKIYAYYADKGPPYHLFGFARAQAAPFDARGRDVIARNKDNPSLMFQGRVKTAKGTDFGYEIELIDLIGRNVKSGGSTLLFGDAKTIPRLEGKR
ncbi:MAG: hypothetical protein U0793_26715 [Gemmataceae bacterium]